MSVFIEVKQEAEFDEKKYLKIFESITANAKKILKIAHDLEVNVSIVSDEEMKKINKESRNENSSTDVLSFSLNTKYDDKEFLGDIIISIDTATKQAEELENTIQEELEFLYCHGLLHLLGYDHQTKDEETKMFDLKKQILNRGN
jgi:probable rRNA maturation factor